MKKTIKALYSDVIVQRNHGCPKTVYLESKLYVFEYRNSQNPTSYSKNTLPFFLLERSSCTNLATHTQIPLLRRNLATFGLTSESLKGLASREGKRTPFLFQFACPPPPLEFSRPLEFKGFSLHISSEFRNVIRA